MKTAYPDLIVNAFKSVQAWKALFFVLAGIVIFETIALGWLASQRTVILVPQHLSNAKSAIELNLGEPYSPDYLTGVAKGDVFVLLNWTPENIEQQYASFISRLTPELHDAQKEVLLMEAKQHTSEGLTQSFYVTRTFVNGSEVTLHGILVRSSAGREIFRGPSAYAINYSNVGNGMLQISGVRQPAENERRASKKN